MKIKVGARRITTALMIGCLILPQALWAQKAVDETPNEFAMVGDLFVARPIGVVMTVGGVAVWLVSLPFTLLSGHASEAAETLMLGPAEATFMRCLGCRNPGYTGKDIAQKQVENHHGESHTDQGAADDLTDGGLDLQRPVDGGEGFGQQIAPLLRRRPFGHVREGDGHVLLCHRPLDRHRLAVTCYGDSSLNILPRREVAFSPEVTAPLVRDPAADARVALAFAEAAAVAEA